MRRLIFILAIAAIPNLCLFGQGKTMVVGSLVNRPHAILVLNPPNADQGFLLPQLSTSERIAIVPNSPQEDGLVVFDTDENIFYYWNNNAWVRGLGDDRGVQSLSYDVTSQILSLTNGGQVSLTTLKEIPSITGNAGKFLTNDGTTLSWVTVSSIGDITSIVAGQGLSGGGVTGDINLSVNTDGSTIGVNGSNALQVADGGITASKIAPNAVGTANIVSGGNEKILATDLSGAVTWIDRSALVDDNQNLSLVGNSLNIQDGNSVDLSNLNAAGNVAGPLSNLAIQNNAVTSAHLTDNAVGAAELADNSVDQNAVQINAITDAQLADNAVDGASIQPGVVNTTHLASGGNDKVLTTSSGGVVTWTDRSAFVDDNQNLSLAGNNLNIEDGAGVNLSAIVAAGQVAGPLSALVIQPSTISDLELADNSVDGAAIQAGAVNTTHIESTGNDKVLTTTSGGVVFWADRSTFTDNQNLGLTGNTLNIDDGAGVDLNLLVAAGQVAGALNNLTIQPDVITDAELADNAVDGAAIQPGVVNTTHLSSGGISKVLTTSGTGVVGWTDRTDFSDDQNLGLAGNLLTIEDGTGVDLSTLNVNGQIVGTINNMALVTNAVTDVELADNAVDGSAIQPGIVNTTHITSGGNDKVLTTTAGGVVAWVDRSTFTDGQNLTLDGNTLNITSGTGVNLDALATSGQVAGPLNNLAVQNNAITAPHIADDAVGDTEIATDAVGASELADNAVDGGAIQNNAVNTNHIVSGGNDKVLTTSVGGVVGWTDRATFTDAQNLSLAGNTLNISNGTGADLNEIVAAGQVAGTLNNLAIQGDAVNSSHIAADAVGSSEIAADAVGAAELANGAVDGGAIQNSVVDINHIVSGGNDKVLTTTAGGAVAWSDRSTFTDAQNLSLSGNTVNISNGTGVSVNNVAHSGDVTGTISASKVAKIQGRDVVDTNPNLNDLLMWNGTAWVPQAVSVTAPTVQYYAVDPAAFVGLEPTNGSNQTVLGLYQDDNTFVAANGDGREIMAPVNLPHGATITRVTVYYSDLDLLGDFTIALYRKSFGGANQTLATRSTLLVTVGVANFDLPAIPVANRVVDNSTYSYRIHVTFTASGQGPTLLDQRLYGIRIEYTK